MKIVLVSSGVLPVPPTGYGGLEQIVADLTICLDKLGHEVFVVAPTESTINHVGKIQLIDCGVTNSNAHWWEQQAYQKYRPMMDSSEFKDAIWHDHTWTKGIYLAKMQNPNLHIMSTLHGMLCYQKPPPLPKPSMAGISKRHADLMSAGLGIPIRYVYNGIDLNKYTFNSTERNERYLFLSRITTFKGTHIFADLIKQIQAKGDIVGDDTLVEDREYVERILRACNDYPNLRYWGGVPRDRTIEFFRESKCYILPCTSGWEEPFGLTVVEAMACGCPVVATRSGAIPELIEQGISGYVVDYISDLKDYLNDDKLIAIKAENCRKRAEMFSREKMTTGYLALYNELLERGGW